MRGQTQTWWHERHDFADANQKLPDVWDVVCKKFAQIHTKIHKDLLRKAYYWRDRLKSRLDRKKHCGWRIKHPPAPPTLPRLIGQDTPKQPHGINANLVVSKSVHTDRHANYGMQAMPIEITANPIG